MLVYWDLVKKLNSPFAQERRDSFSALMKIIDSTSGLNTKSRRRLRAKLIKMDSCEARVLAGRLNFGLEQHEITFENLALCAGVEQREVEEVIYFYRAVSPFFSQNQKISVLVDLCAGNGLNGFYWFIRGVPGVIFIDKRRSRAFEKVSAKFAETYPLVKDIPYIEADLREGIDAVSLELKTDAVVSIHACGDLTDKVIDIAICKNLPFAVMPCCYEKRGVLPYEIMEQFKSKEEATDAVRIKGVLNRGYKVFLRQIPREVTPMNRVIIGLPN